MGKPSAQQLSRPLTAQSYSDDPSSDDALSLHTTGDESGYDDTPQLPSYADSEASNANLQSRLGERSYPVESPPTDEYSIIREPQRTTPFSRNHKKPVDISETSIRMDAQLNEPDALYDYITNYLRHVHPQPTIRIYGYHQATTYRNNKKETERVVDFDIAFGLGHYLRPEQDRNHGWSTSRVASNGDKTYRGTIWRVRAPGSTQDIDVGSPPWRDLRAWCNDFCTSPSALKIFRISRNVTGLDTELLRQQLEPLVRATHYRGNLYLSFPTADRAVDIYSPHWVNQWRISWVRWVFYVTFLWLLTWPVLFLATKKWAIYTIDWAFSIPRPSIVDGGTTHEYAALSETQWLQRHANLIQNLVLEQYRGDATDMPTDADARARPGPAPFPSTGNLHVDSALGFTQGGARAHLPRKGDADDGDGNRRHLIRAVHSLPCTPQTLDQNMPLSTLLDQRGWASGSSPTSGQDSARSAATPACLPSPSGNSALVRLGRRHVEPSPDSSPRSVNQTKSAPASVGDRNIATAARLTGSCRGLRRMETSRGIYTHPSSRGCARADVALASRQGILYRIRSKPRTVSS
nr:hypothetical protein CFP56_20989 [Quercus suber]